MVIAVWQDDLLETAKGRSLDKTARFCWFCISWDLKKKIVLKYKPEGRSGGLSKKINKIVSQPDKIPGFFKYAVSLGEGLNSERSLLSRYEKCIKVYLKRRLFDKYIYSGNHKTLQSMTLHVARQIVGDCQLWPVRNTHQILVSEWEWEIASNLVAQHHCLTESYWLASLLVFLCGNCAMYTTITWSIWKAIANTLSELWDFMKLYNYLEGKFYNSYPCMSIIVWKVSQNTHQENQTLSKEWRVVKVNLTY